MSSLTGFRACKYKLPSFAGAMKSENLRGIHTVWISPDLLIQMSSYSKESTPAASHPHSGQPADWARLSRSPVLPQIR